MSENFNCQQRLAIVLPSLDPDAKFLGVVRGMVEAGFRQIVIVDDGSDEAHQELFRQAEGYPQCTVLHHDVNKGKGRALKTAFRYVLDKLPEAEGVITIDGDGQHLAQDIIACGERMLREQDRVILGCRDFDQPGVPPRSVAGNKTTSRMFRLFGIRLSDTQTGLRAIPRAYLELFCEIEGERFEYETNMLLQMKRQGISFSEQPIATVYDPEDYSSHYNAVKDSLRIARVMLRFLLSGPGFRYLVSAVLSWVVDNGLYLLLFTVLGGSLAAAAASTAAQVIARVLSSLFNFHMNKFFAFRSREPYWSALGKYYCVCVPQTLISVLALTSLVAALSIASPILATGVKVLIEVVLFCLSYLIQKKWVFKK